MEEVGLSFHNRHSDPGYPIGHLLNVLSFNKLLTFYSFNLKPASEMTASLRRKNIFPVLPMGVVI